MTGAATAGVPAAPVRATWSAGQATVAMSGAQGTSWICRSTHASGDGCARRAGVLAGWLALAVLVVLAAADRLCSRAH